MHQMMLAYYSGNAVCFSTTKCLIYKCCKVQEIMCSVKNVVA